MRKTADLAADFRTWFNSIITLTVFNIFLKCIVNILRTSILNVFSTRNTYSHHALFKFGYPTLFMQKPLNSVAFYFLLLLP